MIKLIADSTCDLPFDVIEKYDIGIAPLVININGKAYKDKIDITTNDFFEMFNEIKKPPTTSMPNPTDFLQLYNNAVKDGHKEILCICMSSGTSGSYQSAEIAKDLFYENNNNASIKLHVVDSKSMSHGSGWLILKTAILREQGATFEELVEYNEKYKTNVKHFLSVDDLDHLIRSGRLSNASGFIGKILKIKPIMTMKNARGAIVAKMRGRKAVIRHYVEEFRKRVDETQTNFIIIGYSSDIDYAKTLQQAFEHVYDFINDIYIMQMGVAVSTHVGPGGLSMFYIEKSK